MKIKPFSFLGNLFVRVFFVYALLGCVPTISTWPADMPLSEFMIGNWKVVSRINTDTGDALEIAFPKVSIHPDELSYGETHRIEYNFIGEDTIFVDNKRLTGGETWRLERDGEYLIVYQEVQGFKSTMRLERIKR